MTNTEFMERAAITTEALAAAGKLNPQQANKFIDYVIDESVMRAMTRIERFRPEELYIDKIGVGKRVAMLASEAEDPRSRRGVSTSRVVLKPVDIVVPFEIGDRFKRFNIEGDDVEDHVIRMMAIQLANNLDELWIAGNNNGIVQLEDDVYPDGSTTQYVKDAYLSAFAGFLKLAESGHVVDAENAALSASIFNKALLAMPTKFRKNKAMLKYLLSPDHEQGYRETVSGRLTGLGDQALQAQTNLTPFGVELMPVPLLERNPLYAENSVANNDGTTATQLTHKPMSDLVLTKTTIGRVPEDAYLLATDYTEDETNGTWTRLGGGSIPSAGTIRATYRTAGKMLLTNPQNLIIGIGMDISIEKDRDIWKKMNQFAISVSVACEVEEVDALVMVKNLKDPTV